MQTVSADPRVPEPSSEGLKRSRLNIGVLEEFAQNMAENIMQSFISQVEKVEPEADRRASRFNQNQEMFRRSKEMDPGKDIQTSKGTQPLPQSGLPLVGSLDYPDAPPTTPLLPELERSRYSFARKLKGGLANVFLPSPPPPTPKFKEDDSGGAANDPQVELMEHLMHSLSTEDLARDPLKVGPDHGAKMEAFAEALSCDVIDWVLSDKRREQKADDSDLQLLAHRLAESIITSSLDEAKMLV